MRIAVFASGRGSNMVALAEAARDGQLPGVSIGLVVCDRPGAPVLDHTQRLGLSSFALDPSDCENERAYESEILLQLELHRIDLAVLAGYMRIAGPTLLKVWQGRMINLHPSLLPNFPGKDGIGDAFRAGVSETGVTVHFVDAGVDTGPIIAQRTVKLGPNESLHSLKERIHRVEHQLLHETIRCLAEKKINKVFLETAKLTTANQ